MAYLMSSANGPLWALMVVSLAACEGDAARPPPVRLDLDGSTRPARDAGPPLDCKTSKPSQDADSDGFSRDAGDCDDCDPAIGPAAFDVPGNTVDEDCDGTVLEEPVACDADLDPQSDDADDAARALGLCPFAAQVSRDWGVRDADWARLDGSDELEDNLQAWLPEHFGAVMPREGKRLLILSTGVARDRDDPGYTPECDAFASVPGPMGYSGGVEPPMGFPVDDLARCPLGSQGSEGVPAYNDVGLKITLRVPTNARSLSFDTIFFTHEYPDFVCSPFNDFFAVEVNHENGLPIEDQANVVFDANGDPIGVNTALLVSCRPHEGVALEIPCSDGPQLLLGTGFDKGEASCGVTDANVNVGGASTGWLRTTVPLAVFNPLDVQAREVTLHFKLWDSGDPKLDSSVGIDNIRFEAEDVTGPSTRPISAGS